MGQILIISLGFIFAADKYVFRKSNLLMVKIKETG